MSIPLVHFEIPGYGWCIDPLFSMVFKVNVLSPLYLIGRFC